MVHTFNQESASKVPLASSEGNSSVLFNYGIILLIKI